MNGPAGVVEESDCWPSDGKNKPVWYAADIETKPFSAKVKAGAAGQQQEASGPSRSSRAAVPQRMQSISRDALQGGNRGSRGDRGRRIHEQRQYHRTFNAHFAMARVHFRRSSADGAPFRCD